MDQKHFKGWIKHWDFILIDLILLQVCFVMTSWLLKGVRNPYLNERFQVMAIVLTLSQLLVILFSSHYRGIIRRQWTEELLAIFFYGLEITLLVTFLLFILKRSEEASRLLIGLTVLFFVILDYPLKQLNKWRILHFAASSKRSGRSSW